MTKTQRKTAKWVIVALFAVAVLLGGVMFQSLSPVPGEAQPSGPGTAYLKFEIANKTGSDVCGLNVHFEGLELPVNQAIKLIAPFKRMTPTDQQNRVSLSGGCLAPNDKAVLQFAPGVGMTATLQDYSWIKTGEGFNDLLIPGSFDGVSKRIVRPDEQLPVYRPQEADSIELPLTTFTFELQAMPRGRLLVSQDMVIYEGMPVGVYDQEKQLELTQKLNTMNQNPLAGLFADRQQVQQALDALTVYSPFNGQVKQIAVETVGGLTRVTLKLASLDAAGEVSVAPLDR